jgi:DNA polymerase V
MSASPGDLRAYAQEMRATVRCWTGIPTCVGLGPTKTLAKVGNVAAKRHPTFGGVCDLTGEEARAAVLRAFPVADVWGVGPATVRRLAGVGVTTASGLRDLDLRHARRLGSVVLERIVTELRGVPCLALEVVPPARQGLAVTRSFGRPVSDPAEALEAIAAHATRAGEKLRQYGLVAGRITAFVHTSPHRPGPHRYGARSTRLVPMAADTRELVAAASRCLEAAWRDGYSYVKAGVFLDDLREPADVPPALLTAPRPGSDALMRAVDGLNARYGRNTVFPAAMGVERGWKQRAEHRSPRYTTRLADVPAVSAKG